MEKPDLNVGRVGVCLSDGGFALDRSNRHVHTQVDNVPCRRPLLVYLIVYSISISPTQSIADQLFMSNLSS